MSNSDRAAYAESVSALLKVANGDTGGSTPAALVLLSAYNSYDFTIPVNELCLLDVTNYRHAVRVITARYNGIEPHELVANGDGIFQQLRKDWVHLCLNDSAA